ncbi:hypothetical protein [Bacillus massiliigorillae]|uniref:hypothetical protein n=1 Tax=Bacillus massiliigorillae TaxID=1243664 RepID=UPI0003A5226D|nr:hypothetical protein [Bacillus massiliigorillae]
MAGNIKGITIEIGGETTGLQNALKDVNKQSTSLQTELKQVERALKFDPGNIELLAQKQQILTERIQATSEKLDTLKQAQAQVEAQFQSGQIGAEQYRAFRREIETTEGTLNGLRGQLQNMANEQQRTGNATRELQALFQATGTSVDQFANALGGRLTSAIRNGTATSAQLNQAIERIGQAALGADTDLGRLRAALSNVHNGASIDQIRQDLNRVSQEANEAEQAVNGFGDELKNTVAGLAAGGGIAGAISAALDTSSLNTKIEISMEVPESSKASVKDAINTVTSYGVDAESALEGVRRQWALNKDASDESNAAVVKMAGTIAAAYSGIDFTELIQEANEIGGALNISNEQALGLVNSLLKTGFPPEQLDIISEYGEQLKIAGFSATEVQNILSAAVDTKSWNIDNLLDGLKEGKIGLSEFGLEIPKAMGELLSKTDISAKQMQTWGAAVAKGGEGGKQAMVEVAKALAGVEDATLRNELGVQIFGTKFEDQGMKIVDTMINAEKGTADLKKGIDDVNSSTEKLNTDPTVALRQAFSDLKVALEPLLTTIAEVIGKIAEWVQNNPTLAATLVAIGTAIGILVGAAMALAPLFMGIIAASTPLMASIAAIALPIAGVVAAIGLLIAAGVAVYKNWDEISAYAITIWNGIKDFLSSVWDGIKSGFESAWNGIKDFLSSTWDGIKSTAEAVWNGIKDFFSQWGLTLLAVFGGPLGQLIALITKNWDSIKQGTETAWNNIKTFLSTLWNGIKSIASSVWDGIKSYFTTVLDAYKTAFTTVWNAIKSVVETVWNGLKSTATSVWNSIKSFFTTTLDGLKTSFTTIWDGIKTSVTNVWNTLKSSATSIWNEVKSSITTILNNIKSTFTTVWDSIKNTTSSVFNSIKSTITSIWTSIQSSITTIVNGIKTTVTNIFNSFKSTVTTAMNGVKSAVETGWNKAKSFLDGINLTSVGKDIIRGLINGISSMTSSAIEAITGVVDGVINKAKSLLGIKSPSRVFMEVGEFTNEGFIKGIQSTSPDLMGAIDNAYGLLGDNAQKMIDIGPSSTTSTSKTSITHSSPITINLSYTGDASIQDVRNMADSLEIELGSRLNSRRRMSGVKG